MNGPRCVAIVLAAGASRRMGSPKPLLPLEGSTYLEQVLARLQAAGLVRPLVVLGHGAEEILERVDLAPAAAVIHRRWAEGMLSSLQAGLRQARRTDATAAVVAPVDVPRFDPATVRALMAARRSTRAPVVVPDYRGEHGHPVLFGRELWAELLRPRAGAGARAVVEAHRAELVAVPVDDPWVLRDADTPDEHERMVADASAERGGG